MKGTEPTALERDYATLKALGHSAAKAAEIVLDARRGDPYARQWIATASKRNPT